MKDNIILYNTEDGKAKIELHIENETVWLNQLELSELFQTSKQNISKHIRTILNDGELNEDSTVNYKLTVQNEGGRNISRKIAYYSLDMILAIGYRVRSPRGVQFRNYASTILKEYLIKGFAIDDNRLKNLGGGNYFKELLDRIRDIRSSEKVFYRQVLDLFATSIGMFLTGFDAPTLNTLFVDKNLRYHGLIQAFSRTNRILNKVKTFGNIVCFRDLEKATRDAIKTFGDENSINIILEKSYEEYIHGFKDEEPGKVIKGYTDICNEIISKFPEPTEIILEADKKEFAELFGELLKAENILKNFDEFESFEKIISDRQMQDMKSVYVDIRESIINSKRSENSEGNQIDFSDIEFQIDLLKTDEINLDYILALILEKSKENEDVESLKAEVRRVIRSSLGTRAKEKLIMDFINGTKLSELKNTDDILESFYKFARKEKGIKIKGLIKEEKLKDDSIRFIEKAISKGYVEHAGDELDRIIPPTSRRKGAREKKKESVLEKIRKIVEVFVGI